jgi:hypothetical protein
MSGGSCYDSLRLAESVKPDVPDFTTKDRQFVDVYDTNNTNYQSGQVNFDLQTLVNSSRYIDFKSSYLTIPLKVTLSLSANTFTATAANAFAVGLKNGSIQLLNGLTVNVANQTVVNLQSLSNIPITYNILSTFTSEDQELYGPSMNFCKDTAESTTFDAVRGELNNVVGYVGASLTNPNPVNLGRRTRTTHNGVVPTDGVNALGTNNGNITQSQLSVMGRSFVNVNGGSTLVYTINAQLPLRYCHDLFDKMPLHRGALWQMTFHTHVPYSFVQPLAATTLAITGLPTTNNSLNQFCPFMLSTPGTTAAATGMDITGTAAANLSLVAAIGNDHSSTCILHVAMFDLENSVNTAYIANPRRRVVYRDILRSFPAGLQAVGSELTARANLTAGIARPRGLLIFPHLVSNGIVTTSNYAPALLSPWSSCGGTTAVAAYLRDFNVQVNGANIYEKSIRYRYDHYLREQFGVLSSTGNGVDGMRVGLINEQDFNTGYGYVYVNLERHPKANDNVPASIDIEITNGGKVTTAYMCWIIFEREFEIDSFSGKLII